MAAERRRPGHQVVGWVLAALTAGVVGVAIWNLPQGGPTEAGPAGGSGGVIVGYEGPGFDQQAFDDAQSVQDLNDVPGFVQDTTGPTPSPVAAPAR